MAPKPRTFTRELPCKLTDKEKALKSEKLVADLSEISELELRKKAATAELSANIRVLRATASQLAGELKRGEEFREISCYERPVWGSNEVELIRADTKEVVQVRGMLPEERQQALEYEGDGIPAPATPKGRGRKKKAEAESPAAEPANGNGHAQVLDLASEKKKRGRPKKSATTEATTPAEV
jgi:hypothetical protein